ncbi:hypothetical protein CH68_1084 [Francisella tularensis subsp. holarctica]|uniref:DUF1338 domain-containing protein n=1 Tax=Francisella tularensis subsp. holarctica (strain LVS) TaxID=376619 RepID=A0AAI8BIS3_FRATH|nr:hypothetical protein DA46_1791 [Francisella tularensis subsp. holarctica]AJI59859.1 hypothetical protein AW21_1911 [Francisella tularensis subsp. holarctica LVS]AJI65631.1 hypothetical protein CH67_1352 [Francisella tularensis subsp. holarctica]AJI66510.1 hypothetical protein CH68_1084 [Francisella tularensis subsp. holarctica]
MELSRLLTNEFSEELQQTLKRCVDLMPQQLLNNPENLLLSGVSWQIDYATYQKLLEESEYAAWFYAFGFRANHFTVFINNLKKFSEVSQVNTFLGLTHQVVKSRAQRTNYLNNQVPCQV